MTRLVIFATGYDTTMRNAYSRHFQSSGVNASEYYSQLQDEDFCLAILNNRQPALPGEEARLVVELVTAIYRSTRHNAPVSFPLKPEA